jgi:hypothetical protein
MAIVLAVALVVLYRDHRREVVQRPTGRAGGGAEPGERGQRAVVVTLAADGAAAWGSALWSRSTSGGAEAGCRVR